MVLPFGSVGVENAMRKVDCKTANQRKYWLEQYTVYWFEQYTVYW